MIKLAENIKTSFGAKYVAEDTASYILYGYSRLSQSGGGVDFERFARFLGLDVMCEYITGDCTEFLGVAAFEPQRIRAACGNIDVKSPAVIAERDIIERGECGLYNFTLALMCSEALFYAAKHVEEESAQLSFGLDSVESERRKYVSLDDAFNRIIETEECAESFALKLAMPKNGFKRQTIELYSYLGVNRATVTENNQLPFVLSALSEVYNVPQAAVIARMRELNLY